MQIRLLGTGSSDGWPNAFCHCASCVAQADRPRTPTSLVIDGRLLVDCGPEAPRQALRLGVDLAAVTSVLIGHAHPDHCAPQFLMHRSWTDAGPLRVVGPEPVVRACREWLDPDQTTVEFTTVTAGDEVVVDGYVVRVLPAEHHADGEAGLYEIRSSEGVRVLYATDTGELPAGFEDGLADGPLDAVFLEETFGWGERTPSHHNLPLFKQSLERLRSSGHVDEATACFAIHMGHDNPPEPELTAALAAMGARPTMDGDVVTLGARQRPPLH